LIRCHKNLLVDEDHLSESGLKLVYTTHTYQP
jgi:hypothetical protein